MKNILLACILLFVSIGLFAQTSLTYKNNALLPGDASNYREVQFVDPGNAGPNQVWDFSKIQYKGKDAASTIQPASMQKVSGAGDYNLLLNENGYDYFMNSTEARLEERGYTSQEKKMTLTYSVPVVKMKYPFFYGDQFTAPFTGVAFFSETNRIDFGGDMTVSADAYGTLVLPEMTVPNTLRVKSVKKGLQISMCGSTEINIVKYSWFAAGYRYPLMSINIIENRYRGGNPDITKTAYTNTQQHLEGSTAGAATTGKQAELSDVSVMLFPNPFSENLSYNYFLRKQLPVSIELYDMSGKYSLHILKNQVQTEGLHTGDLDAVANGLAPGVYYIRFTFDKQVVVNKIVKI